MDARSWFGMTFAKESPAWCATGAVRFRRIFAVPSRSSEGPFTIRFADLGGFILPTIRWLASF